MKEDEPSLIKRILELVSEFPRFDYRSRLLQSEGWKANAKRIDRLWRQEGLKVPKGMAKRRRLGSADGGIVRRKAEFISRRVRDFLESIDVGTSAIEPGSPWQNGFVKSFNSPFRDECLNCEGARSTCRH